jgi:hypothetical protein
MKTLIPILIGLLVVGCGESAEEQSTETDENSNTPEKPVKELTAEEKKVVGTYSGLYTRMGQTHFRSNGLVFWHYFGEKEEVGKWSIIGKEVHFRHSFGVLAGDVAVYSFNSDDSLSIIASIDDGKRTDFPKEEQVTCKRVKDTKPKSETKEPPANAGKELKPEDVVGSYEAGLGGITFRFVLLDSGVVENYFNGIKEPEDAKWKIQGAEVHIEKGKSDGTIIVNKIEPNGDFTVFARIRNGKREDFQNRTYKKIK